MKPTLAIQYVVAQGAPSSYFEPIYIRALSTLEEARAFASGTAKAKHSHVASGDQQLSHAPRGGDLPSCARQGHPDRAGCGRRILTSAPTHGGTIGKGRRPCFTNTQKQSPLGWECK